MADEDWEEWDGRSPFWAHCVAGSLAGVMEHAAIYPLDTVRTHIQVCAACLPKSSSSSSRSSVAASSNNKGLSSALSTMSAQQQQQRLPLGTWQTIRHLVSEPVAVAAQPPTTTAALIQWPPVTGLGRLFRGIQTILVGCIPAHALYFSSYEIIKGLCTDHSTGKVSTAGSSLAGAVAVTMHDCVMTPIDTLKQRMQLGHYQNMSTAVRNVYRTEGVGALYRSFPVTLLSNLPYGMIMVSTNEWCKDYLQDQQVGYVLPHWQVIMVSSSVGGLAASACTTPLDRIKTALQTQALQPVCAKQAKNLSHNAATTTKTPENCPYNNNTVKHMHWRDAARNIYRTEGMAGFWRGVTPRVLSHTPAVAISWTTYETAKQYLLSL